MSVSGLANVASTTMMHQPHQVRSVDSPGDRFALTIPFDGTPAFGRSNRIFLPPLEMVVEDAYIELQLSTLSVAGATVAQTHVLPTANWIGTGGIQLLYKAQSLYTASEPELILTEYLNTENAMQLTRRLALVSDYAPETAVAGYQLAPQAGTVTSYFIHLKPLIEKELGNAGPLNAYAANAWSIDLNLNSFANCLSSDTNAITGTPSIKVEQFRLHLVGHREDAANAMAVSQSLAGDGIKCVFNQANHSPQTLPTTSANHVVALSDLEGEATDVWLMIRDGDAYAASSSLNRVRNTWETGLFAPSANSDLLSLGTSSNPTRIYGQPQSLYLIQNLFQGTAYDGTVFVEKWPVDGANKVREHVSAMCVALCEAATMGQRFGTYSGSVRLKNDFRATFNFAAAPGGTLGYRLDIIVFIRRVLVLTHAGIIMVNEE